MGAFRYILIQTIICLLFANSIIVRGQESDSIYFESSALSKCILQFPKDYNPDNFFPLVISLHGGGSSYKDFKDIRKHFENPEFIIATPQAPYKWLMGDKIAYDWSAWPTGDLMFMQKALKLTSNSIKNLVHSITDQYNISEVYIMGFSQGSIITQIAGINNHNLIRGMIILSGPEINHPGKPEIVWPAEDSIKKANHLLTFIAHGKSDKLVDFDIAIKSKTIYEKFGYTVELFEFEGGHEINPDVMKNIEKWISKQE
jgi:phospholipase/carboxylesterase